MEEDKTAIEELKAFAKKTNREFDFDDKTYVASGINPRNLVKQHVIITSLINDEPYLVNYCDMASIGDNSMFSGLFFPIDFPVETRIKLRQKNVLDKMNLFSRKTEFKTQSKKFDSKVIIEESAEKSFTKLFYSHGVQTLILDIFKLDPRLKLCVNHIDVGIVLELKNKSTLGIYITEQWLLDEAILKKLYSLVGKLRMKIQVGHEVHS